MPRIIRWFPVTHDINADPDLWELRELYGDRAAFVWLEMLSVADRNDGLVGPDSDQTRNQLASKCRSSRVKVGLILGWCRVKGWLVSEDGLRIANYWKYHKPRETKEILAGKSTGSPPILSEPSEPNHLKENIKRKVQYPSDFEVLDEIREWAQEKGMPDPDGQLEAFKDHHVSKASRFIDWHAAFRTWLRNQKRWSSKNGNGKPPVVTQTSQVPAYQPKLGERKVNPEIRDGLKRLVNDLTDKMAAKE